MHVGTESSGTSSPRRDTATRRDMLLGAATIGALAAATPLLTQSTTLGARHLVAAIDSISDAVIPGSSTTQPGTFIAGVLKHEWRGLRTGHVRLVLRHIARTARGELETISPAHLSAVIEQLDRASFTSVEAPRAANPPPAPHAGRMAQVIDAETAEAWKIFKRALLTAYYTSEKGGAGDLAFELVPGRWEPDIPLSQAPHPLSNDWLAIWFS